MILARPRITEPIAPARNRTSKGSAPSAAGGGTDAQTDHVEVVFRLPTREGADVLKSLREAERAPGSAILLWAGRKGEVDIIIREPGATLKSGKSVIMSRAQYQLPPESPPEDRGSPVLDMGELVIHPGRHEVLVRGKATAPLTHTEFGTLHFLARHAGWVFNRQQIVEGVKGRDYPVTDRAVDVQVAGLRKKLGPCAHFVQTVRGVGYRFRD